MPKGNPRGPSPLSRLRTTLSSLPPSSLFLLLILGIFLLVVLLPPFLSFTSLTLNTYKNDIYPTYSFVPLHPFYLVRAVFKRYTRPALSESDASKLFLDVTYECKNLKRFGHAGEGGWTLCLDFFPAPSSPNSPPTNLRQGPSPSPSPLAPSAQPWYVPP